MKVLTRAQCRLESTSASKIYIEKRRLIKPYLNDSTLFGLHLKESKNKGRILIRDIEINSSALVGNKLRCIEAKELWLTNSIVALTSISDSKFNYNRSEDGKEFPNVIEEVLFVNCVFEKSSLKGMRFNKCAFCDCFFSKIKFRDTTFKACSFSGTVFSNLMQGPENLSFDTCQFSPKSGFGILSKKYEKLEDNFDKKISKSNVFKNAGSYKLLNCLGTTTGITQSSDAKNEGKNVMVLPPPNSKRAFFFQSKGLKTS